MNVKEYTTEISARLALRSFFIYAFAASLIVNVILAFGLIVLDKKRPCSCAAGRNHEVFLARCQRRLSGVLRADGTFCFTARA